MGEKCAEIRIEYLSLCTQCSENVKRTKSNDFLKGRTNYSHVTDNFSWKKGETLKHQQYFLKLLSISILAFHSQTTLNYSFRELVQ